MGQMPIKYANFMKDGIEQPFLPITSEEAVFDANGNALKNKMDNVGWGIYEIRSLLESPTMRKNTFRGANLGSEFTTKQKAAIADGSFSEFFIGDYWEKDGIHWRIADMNYWMNTGMIERGRPKLCSTNHLVIIPDEPTEKSVMNDTAIVTGGYKSSKVHMTIASNPESVSSIVINEMFGGESILTHYEILTNGVDDGGRPNSTAFEELKITLLTEFMVYGSRVLGQANDGDNAIYLSTIDKTQLALFGLEPRYINTAYRYWLRDIASSKKFTAVEATGQAFVVNANSNCDIRPVFAIHG